MDTNILLMDSRRDRNSTLIASFIAVLALLICHVAAAAPDQPATTNNPAALIQKQCDAGNADACTKIGEMYVNGQGVVQNYVKAAKTLDKACKNHSAQACYILGLLNGEGKASR